MNVEDYKILISNLPVRLQGFTTKRSTWKKAETEIDWLKEVNDNLFNSKKTLTGNRQSTFNANKLSIREFIIKVIYWGYPRNMRGNHFINILNNIETVEDHLIKLKNIANPASNDFIELTQAFKKIPGLGLSTYSKLLYFLDIKFNGNDCVILDQRLIDILASNACKDFISLGEITYTNADKKYLDFLSLLNRISIKLETKAENIEQFLFVFGNYFNIIDMDKQEISTSWDGYCPESLLKGKTVRMKLNQSDFFESEETGLQICIIPGVQAVILKFRGNGKYRTTPSYADEIAIGEILSPQNTDMPPFNNPAIVFENSIEIEKYIDMVES